MAIDYIIDYPCPPKEKLGPEGIVERLKGQERAEVIIQLFRDNGDDRPPSQMGFEFTRATPDGEDENTVIIVQDLLDEAAELEPLAHHCQGCPANRTGKPFGCVGFIQYPITEAGEQWLLDRLPVPDEPLIWLLLRQGLREFKYDGETVAPLRANANNYFESATVQSRLLGELSINANQIFEMIFAVGHIIPNHAALLLLFFNAIPRDLEAQDIMNITPASEDARTKHPFTIEFNSSDDRSVADFKQFLYALYLAWTLNVRLLIDA